jgi:pimeloyl-ACP methyl ester carboxylesterase
VRPHETTAPTRDAELCVHAFGDPGDPAVLLIQGAEGAMDWWEDDFCARIARGGPSGGAGDGRGRYVVRYDHRDTGRSTTYPPGEPGYTGRDLAEDAVAVLDALGVARAHLVGISMGGALAQVVALEHPDRVASLTLVATSAVGDVPDGLDLPGMTDEVARAYAAMTPPDWSDPQAATEALVDGFRPLAGSGPFDEDGLRAVAARVVARSTSLASTANHHATRPGALPGRPVTDLRVPTLVVHGAEDPLFPLPHGEALASLIPGARLLVLDRTGHELPRSTWDTFVPAVLAHTAAA